MRGNMKCLLDFIKKMIKVLAFETPFYKFFYYCL
jgi:hypothetical protein